MNIKNVILSKFSSAFGAENDSYKNPENDFKGILERMQELVADEYDENLSNKIEKITEILHPAKTLDIFLNYLEKNIGISDIINTENTKRRLAISYATLLFKKKGTFESYEILFKLLGFPILQINTITQNNIYDNIIYDDDKIYDANCFNCIDYEIQLNCNNLLNSDDLIRLQRCIKYIEPIYMNLVNVKLLNGSSLYYPAVTNVGSRFIDNNIELVWDLPSVTIFPILYHAIYASNDLNSWILLENNINSNATSYIDTNPSYDYYRIETYYLVNNEVRVGISNTTSVVTEIVFNYSAFNNNGTYKVFDDDRGLFLEIVPLSGIDPIDIEIVADAENDQDKVTVTNTTSTFTISDTLGNNPILTNGAGNYQLAIRITDSVTGTPAFDRIREFGIRWIAAFGDFPAAFFALSNLENLELMQMKGAGGAGFNEFPTQIGRLENLTTFRQFRAFEAAAARRIAPAILEIEALQDLEWADSELGTNVNAKGLAAGNLDILASSLPNLTDLRLLATGLNILPDLSSLPLNLFQIGLGNLIPTTQLSNLNPQISNLQIQSVVGDVSVIDVGNYGNLFSLSFQNSLDISADALPANLVDASFASLDYRNCFKTQVRTDTFIDTFYAYAVANGSITGVGNFNEFTLVYTLNTIPTGTVEAPVGYANHVSNGNPVNQGQKMFVLINNYHITILTDE